LRNEEVLGECIQVSAKLDPKGRLVMPARLRRKLQAKGVGSLVFKAHPVLPAIFAFTAEQWKAQVEDPLRAGSFLFDSKAMIIAHALAAGAQTVDLDSHGRVLLPAALREEADLGHELVLQTMMDRLEIWSVAGWAERKARVAKAITEIDLAKYLGPS